MKKFISILAVSILIVLIYPPNSAYAIEESKVEEYTEEIGKKYNISPEIIQAIIERESSYDEEATNGDCVGLMQVSTKWNEERMEKLGITDIYDPYSNILVGTDFLAELFQIGIDKGYGDDIYYVLMRYSMKTTTANKLYLNEEYSDYAIGICDRAFELEREHGK